MGHVVFFTGFPGFLGKKLSADLLADPAVEEVVFIVQSRFRDAAIQALAKVADENARKKGLVLEGDITVPGCGLDQGARKKLFDRVTHAYHLAAAYDLALPREVGFRVNVDGTKNVLDLVEGAPRFERFAHISTCAISGTHEGVFTEDDFDVRQSFKNFYEETKYLSEAEVRSRWGRIPTTIFRPPVVVGDSRTGEAEKIDGPYYAFLMIRRHLHLVAPRSRFRLNMAPIDYIAAAVPALMKKPDSKGRVYHLSDPAPLTIDEFFDASADALGERRSALRLPAKVFRPLFSVPAVRWLSGVPRQSFDYSLIDVEWACQKTQRALEGTGVRCPPFKEYVGNLARYFKENLEKTLPKAGRW